MTALRGACINVLIFLRLIWIFFKAHGLIDTVLVQSLKLQIHEISSLQAVFPQLLVSLLLIPTKKMFAV